MIHRTRPGSRHRGLLLLIVGAAFTVVAAAVLLVTTGAGPAHSAVAAPQGSIAVVGVTTDVNCDGKTDAIDALDVLLFLVHLTPASPPPAQCTPVGDSEAGGVAGDADCSTHIEMSDVLALLGFVAHGGGGSLPTQCPVSSPTATATPIGTPTPTPTATPPPTASPTPSPTPTLGDIHNCGAPGNDLSGDGSGPHVSGIQCINGAGVLTCDSGFADANHVLADGCEVNLNTDPNNCGSVGNVIPSPVPNGTTACVAGQGTITCDANYADADQQLGDGCEVNLLTDQYNCGSVGTVVPPVPNGTSFCYFGVATINTCDANYADADQQFVNGCEVNLLTDQYNCGSVGTVVPPVPNGTSFCYLGVPTINTCDATWYDANQTFYDGCETQTPP